MKVQKIIIRKKELISRVAIEQGVPVSLVTRIVNGFLGQVIRGILGRNTVALKGIGRFYQKDMAQRFGIHPIKRTRIVIKPGPKVCYEVSQALNAKVKGKTHD